MTEHPPERPRYCTSVVGVHHNAYMSFMQLLAARTGREDRHITALPTEPNRSFRELETKDRAALLWGNTDLLKIAIALTGRRFWANHVQVLDQALAPIEGLQQEIDVLLEAINSRDFNRAYALASDEFFGCVFGFIGLRRGKPDYQTLEVFQNGTINFGFPPVAKLLDEVIEVIQRAS